MLEIKNASFGTNEAFEDRAGIDAKRVATLEGLRCRAHLDPKKKEEGDEVDDEKEKDKETNKTGSNTKGLKVDGLVYNLQIVLPETRDPKVYDAIFKSLREHLG